MWDECDQSCTNTNGSYSCSCRANFTVDETGHCKHQTSKTNKFFLYIINEY